jgi:hypothetical protein
MLYPLPTPGLGVTRLVGFARVLAKDYAMTAHLIHLTAQIQHWLNQSVARHLAAQAERLEPATKH